MIGDNCENISTKFGKIGEQNGGVALTDWKNPYLKSTQGDMDEKKADSLHQILEDPGTESAKEGRRHW